MNQILAAAALFGAATLLLAPLAAESGRQIGSRSQSISEMMEDSRERAGQALVRTWAHSANGNTTVHISSIGERAVSISAVMAGGAAAPFKLYGPDRSELGSVEPGALAVLEVNGTGRVRAVSQSGKLFDFG